MNTPFPDRDIRQRGLVPADKLANVHALVIGVGAIGRQVALQLASLGVSRMTLYDHDQVSVENLAVQGYWPEDLGQPKVEATAKICQLILPEMELNTVAERFRRSELQMHDAETKLVVFACVDSINTRKMLWDSLYSQVALFVDGRMYAEIIRVLAIDDRMDPCLYLGTLFPEREAHTGSCTSRSTIYSASIAAGLLVSQFARWLRGIPVVLDQTLNLLSCELSLQEKLTNDSLTSSVEHIKPLP